MARKLLRRKTRKTRKARKTRRRQRGGAAENGDYGGAQTGLPKNGDYSDIDAVPRTQSIEQLGGDQDQEQEE
jgi:hypothetical protein